ncbi:MAG: hypothetical protein ABMA14_17440 [Hyphomonadaceae bacterium]
MHAEPFLDVPILVAHRNCRHAHPAPFAIMSAKPLLAVVGITRFDAPFPFVRNGFAIVWMDGIGPSDAEHFVGGLPRKRHPQRLWRHMKAGGRAGPRDSARRFHERSVAQLTFASGFFQPFALRDGVRHSEPRRDLAVRSDHRNSA